MILVDYYTYKQQELKVLTLFKIFNNSNTEDMTLAYMYYSFERDVLLNMKLGLDELDVY